MRDNKSVGIWIRVSTEDQAQGESPEHHEKRGRFYAESKGWNVREVYRLDGVSGKAIIDHPDAKRMLADVAAGRISGLIFSKLARLARNTRELLEFADRFEAHGAHLISLQEAIDTSTPAGRLFYTIIAAMAQWEREEISSRVAASVPIRAKLGKPLGGAASFGYQWVDGKLVPDEKEAPIRALIYALFLEHRRKKTVARILNERGFRTRNGSPFSDTTIDRLLDDPTAKGVYRANHTKSLGSGKKWVRKPEDEWVLREVPAIVSADLWDRCQAIRVEQEKAGKRQTKKVVHLFTGYAFCQCGAKMNVPSNSPKYICVKCRNKIPVGDLEEVFRSQLTGFFSSPTEIAGYLEKADETIKEKEAVLASLISEQKKVTAQKDKVYSAYVDDDIDQKTFGRQFRPLTARLDEIEAEMPRLQAEIDFLRINLRSSDVVLEEARDLYSHWLALEPQQKRTLIESITQRITVGSADISIDLCYLPPLHEHVAEGQRNFTLALTSGACGARGSAIEGRVGM